MVGVVILRYNGARSALEQAVLSVLQSTAANLVGDIVLLDNCSTINPETVEEVAEAFAQQFQAPVRAVRLSENFGFSGGVNRGIALLSDECDFVLLLNDDASLESSAIEFLEQALADAPASVVSAVPKVFLGNAVPQLLESVGVCVNERGEAKNVGLGQPDLGQFDAPAESFGPSFGVAMFRRSAFRPSEVGPLNESFFLYYEDVEWNWRAWRLGFRSMTVPAARAQHTMSASSRSTDQGSLSATEAAYAFKHRYIERNLVVSATTHLPRSAAVRVWLSRWPRLVKGGITGRFPKASFAAALDCAARLPSALLARHNVNRRRKNTNPSLGDVFCFWRPEPIFFDPVTYNAQYSWEALRVAAEGSSHLALAAAAAATDELAARTAAANMSDPMQALVASYLDLLVTSSGVTSSGR